MADVEVNVDAWAANLKKLIDSFDFTVPGIQKGLGQDCIDTVVEGIEDRVLPGAINPDQTPWKPNSEKYKKWKARVYNARQVGVLTAQMLSHESLRGKPTVGRYEIQMRYGTGRPPTRAFYAPNAKVKADTLTDIEKAVIFSKIKKIGRFYAFDKRIEQNLQKLAQRVLNKWVKRIK
jgi:hypothetical protein